MILIRKIGEIRGELFIFSKQTLLCSWVFVFEEPFLAGQTSGVTG